MQVRMRYMAVLVAGLSLGAGTARADSHVVSSGGTLLQRAEALDDAAVGLILSEAFASIGCVLPGDLVTVFEVYLIDRAMTALGAPVGAEVARQGYFARGAQAERVEHADAEAVLAVARALEGAVSDAIRSGRLRLRRGLFEVAACTPEGTLFALAPYAVE